MGEVEPLDSKKFLDDGICPECVEFWFPGHTLIIELFRIAVDDLADAHRLADISAAYAKGAKDIANHIRSRL